MKYNQCLTCRAKDGKAGVLIDGNCLNCHDTKEKGAIVIHSHLQRTDKEIQKTFGIIK